MSFVSDSDGKLAFAHTASVPWDSSKKYITGVDHIRSGLRYRLRDKLYWIEGDTLYVLGRYKQPVLTDSLLLEAESLVMDDELVVMIKTKNGDLYQHGPDYDESVDDTVYKFRCISKY